MFREPPSLTCPQAPLTVKTQKETGALSTQPDLNPMHPVHTAPSAAEWLLTQQKGCLPGPGDGSVDRAPVAHVRGPEFGSPNST